ncbi:hypothetical protein PCASD_05143 [Puccinia coronata f. sp. avenae]|uniref:DUF7872 domain-containing protein n=1 Tax=Puccinia coronata f. sp. avenae TaxID=200324 RepID=A0A2N5V3U2_9BASI|nr:hypothetical protein PCASD_05143 [Puccinia coronata f. sp. avenae]
MRHFGCLIISLVFCPIWVLGGTLETRAVLSRPPAPPPDQCLQNIELTPDTWKKLEMDKYIASIEGIDKMNLTTLARAMGAANFFCGIGLHCNAGQLCNPVAGKNWLVLVAIQRWNSYLNSLYQGVADAVTVMRDVSADMITDFIPDTVEDKSMFGWGVATVVLGILGGFTGVLTPILATKPVLQAVGVYGSAESIASAAASNFQRAQSARLAGDVVTTFVVQGDENTRLIALAAAKALEHEPKLPALTRSASAPSLSLTAPGAVHRKRSTASENPPTAVNTDLFPQSIPSDSGHKLLQKRGKPPPSAFAYQRYAEMDTHLAAIQNRIQKYVAAVSAAGVSQPIFNENGLAKVLLEGAMFQKFPSQLEDQEKHKAFAKLTALDGIFKAQNMFVTVNCDPCSSKGPGGAWPQDKFLSYCTPQGSMMNIIRASGIDARNEFRNPLLLSSKYGFTTEYLVRKAADCQKKFGFYTLKRAPEPTDVNSDCVFSIPVCDCADSVVHHARKKKKGTVRACRRVGTPI